MEIVDEQVSAVGRAFLGMTMGCARCHDHPFDPVPTAEYYALAGIFRSTNSSRPGNVANFIERELRDSNGEARKKHKIQADFLNKRLKTLEAELKELRGSPQKKSAKNHNPEKLDGIVIDDVASTKSGSWTKSTHTKGYVGEGYVHATGNGKSLTFNANIPRSGQYEVQVSYTPGPNRASNTQVTIFHDTGEKKISVNQKKNPSILGSFLSLGKFHFEKGEWGVVRISTDKSNGVVIGDSVRLLEINGLNTPPAITKGDTVKKTDAKSDDRKKELQQNIASIKKEIERATRRLFHQRQVKQCRLKNTPRLRTGISIYAEESATLDPRYEEVFLPLPRPLTPLLSLIYQRALADGLNSPNGSPPLAIPNSPGICQPSVAPPIW